MAEWTNRYCARCGRTVTQRTGWICSGCGSAYCVSCHHDELACKYVPTTPPATKEEP